MKRIALILAVLGVAACVSRAPRPERFVDDEGVETVLNGLEPSPSPGELSSLVLVEETTIDTEEDDVARAGLPDIGLFDVDSLGNVYFAGHGPNGETVIKVDPRGAFCGAFARSGQGPGEVQGIQSLLVGPADEVVVTDSEGNRAAVYAGDGRHMGDIRLASRTKAVLPLGESSRIVWESRANPAPGVLFWYPLNLVDDSFETVKELDRGVLEDPISGERLKGTYHLQSWTVSGDRIYTACQERGYEIFCYDWKGNMIRKIRKVHTPVPVPEAHKKEFLAQFEAPQFAFIRAKVYFPEAMPPFVSIAADDSGYLFVMTYETGNAHGEWIFDVFDRGGAFAFRASIPVRHDWNGMHARVRNGRFYAVQEKESGFKALKIYRLVLR
jgi:hypothetical protein